MIFTNFYYRLATGFPNDLQQKRMKEHIFPFHIFETMIRLIPSDISDYVGIG